MNCWTLQHMHTLPPPPCPSPPLVLPHGGGWGTVFPGVRKDKGGATTMCMCGPFCDRCPHACSSEFQSGVGLQEEHELPSEIP